MAAANLLALIDDIATLLDDVSAMTKVAAKKTAAVLGDDLALNAEQVIGVSADRELPVVWAVFKGALVNKLILVPTALVISALAPWAITPMLMIGGAFLCFEGFEKISHPFLHSKKEIEKEHQELLNAVTHKNIDMVDFEKNKIRGAIRTDFILSAEIIVITLGTVTGAALINQIVVLSFIATSMTVGVYGLVAGIVKIDDAGLHLSKRTGAGLWNSIMRRLGEALFSSAPYLMKTLAIVGTVAMFIVGGGILTHGLKSVHHLIQLSSEHALNLPAIGNVLSAITPIFLNTIFGIIVGAILVSIAILFKKIKK